jgi:phenylpropionate dioxygenase-like ring-hydroxylating dioxygenase large terminal subunit
MRLHPIKEIRTSHDDGRPLPGVAYRDEIVFSVESDSILRDGWISVACGQNVAKSGELFPVRIAGQSLLVVRDDQGEIQVFYNLCRHRGAPLASEKCRARGGRIVCPYHAWSFGLDGGLVAAPHLQRNGSSGRPFAEEREGLDLLPLRTAVWRDIVFVNLSADAEPFEDFIRPLDRRLAPWTADEIRPLSSDEYTIQANWKLAAENFIDAYHLPVVHPQIGGGFDWVLGTEDVEVSDDILGLVIPDGYGDDSDFADSPLPRFSGLVAGTERRIEVFSIFPNTLILVEPDFQQVIVLRPQSSGVTHETFANYLVSDASQEEDLAKERKESYRTSIEVNDQDAVLLAGLQLTRSMDVGGDTQLVEAWDRSNRRFQRLWARKLLAGLRE